MAQSHARGFGDTVTDFKSDFSKQNIWRIVVKAFALILAFAVILVAVYFSLYFYRNESEKENLNFLQSVWSERKFLSDGFDKLKAENKDICGWLKISDTKINNPVLKSEDITYYVNHNARNKKSRLGAVHFANNCTLAKNSISQNICISAENLNDSLMFGDLKKFRDIDFIKTYPEITLYLESGEYKYTVFSVCVADSLSGQDKFDYKDNDLKNYALYKGQAYNRSLFNIPVEINPDSKILTLVTDTFDFDGAKLVVSAKLISGENDITVDSSVISVNKNSVQSRNGNK